MPLYTLLLRNAPTLKTRLAACIAVLFGMAVIALTFYQLRETRASMREMLSAQQNTLVTRAAEEIDEKFRDRRTALVAVGEAIAPHLEHDGTTASEQLRERRGLQTMFDTVFIFSPEGKVLAMQPGRPQLHNINVANRAYFRESVDGRRLVISQPYRGPSTGLPLVMMTSPIYDSNGKVIAVLAGAINLLNANFLGNIGKTPVGRSGYFYVVTRGGDPVIVSHPDSKRILTPVTDAAQSVDRAGFEGTIESVNSRGIRGLASYKRLKETNWTLGAILPVDEAFAPIEKMQRKTVFAGGIVALCIAVAVWFLVRRALHPLDALRRNVRDRMENPQGAIALRATRQDEIGQLTHDFNRLMALQQRTESALAENQERLVTITDNLPVLIGYIDQDLRLQFTNQTYTDWFGYDHDSLKGMHVRELIGERDFAKLEIILRQALQGYPVTVEREIITLGRKRQMRGTYLPHYGAGNKVCGIYVLVMDITEQKSAEQNLEILANHDPLTGLVNRGAFNKRLGLAIARAGRSDKQSALMYLDVDHFKTVNDTYGHGIGDRLLKEFSTRLLAAVRKTDVVGRLGGDEFVILLEDLADASDAELVGQKIVDAMQTHFIFEGVRVRASTSIGITIFDAADAALMPSELLQRADRALYDAKHAGRNTFRMLATAGQYRP